MRADHLFGAVVMHIFETKLRPRYPVDRIMKPQKAGFTLFSAKLVIRTSLWSYYPGSLF